MWQRLGEVWLPRLLFLLSMALAAGLGALVWGAQFLPDEEGEVGTLLRLFAHDAIVRKTAIAAAIGLAVTACVFFRPSVLVFLKLRKARKQAPPPIAGA